MIFTKIFDGQFWEDITKVFIDKLLIAFLIVFAGYYLNRLLEKYKAGLADKKIIFADKIRVYNELQQQTNKMWEEKNKLTAILLDDAFNKRMGLTIDLTDDIKTGWANYLVSFDELRKLIGNKRLFISNEAVEKLQSFMQLINFSGAFHFDNPEKQISILNNDEITIALTTAQNWLYEEINKN